MKVQRINSSSINTSNQIKKAFIELLDNCNNLNNIKVKDILAKTKITRSCFYTHYGSILDVAKDVQQDTVNDLLMDTKDLESLKNGREYADKFFNYLEKNESLYNVLSYGDDANMFIKTIDSIVNSRIKIFLKDKDIENKDLKIELFSSGFTMLLTRYFKKINNYSLEEIKDFAIGEFKKMFLN